MSWTTQPVDRGTVAFNLVPERGTLPIPIELNYSYVPGSEADVDRRFGVFAGIGGEKDTGLATVQRIADIGEPGAVVIDALPYWLVEPTPVQLTNLAVECNRQAITGIWEQLELGDAPRQVVFSSQAAAGGLRAAAIDQEAFNGDIATLDGMGFDFINGKRQPTIFFMGAMLLTSMQREQLRHPILASSVGKIATKRLLEDIRCENKANRFAQIRFALDQDSRSDVQTILDSGRRVGVFRGRHELPFRRTRRSLQERGLQSIYYEDEGSHSALITAPERILSVAAWLDRRDKFALAA